VLAERLLLLRVLPRAALAALLALLRAAEGPRASMPEAADATAGATALTRALDGVAAAWGSAAHVTHAPLAQQRYLTAALLQGLDELPAAAAEALVAPLLSGVEQHLRSGLDAVRKLGMRVAERVSIVLDPDKPLHFEASDDEDDGDDGGDGERATAAVHLGAAPPQSAAAPEGRPSGGARGSRGRGAARRGARRAAARVEASSDEEEADPDAVVTLGGVGGVDRDGDWDSDAEVGAGASAVGVASEPTGGEDGGEGEDEDEGEEESEEGEEGEGEEDVEEDDDGSDVESLPAYDLEDNRGDLRRAQAPRHLRHLLAGLRAIGSELASGRPLARLRPRHRGAAPEAPLAAPEAPLAAPEAPLALTHYRAGCSGLEASWKPPVTPGTRARCVEVLSPCASLPAAHPHPLRTPQARQGGRARVARVVVARRDVAAARRARRA